MPENNIIADLFNHFLNCMNKTKLFVQNRDDKILKGCNPNIRLIQFDCINSIKDDNLVYISDLSGLEENNFFQRMICDYLYRGDLIIYVDENQIKSLDFLGEKLITCRLPSISLFPGYICLAGKTFSYIEEKIPDDFRVLAIMHCFNEEDIIEKTGDYLIKQGIDVCFVDNWSDDGTYEKLQRFCGRYPERTFLERFPDTGRTKNYEWYKQLEHTEELCRRYDYNWYIHYDADEMRISPWKGRSLRETLYHIDCAGYNLVENTVIDFRMTEKMQSDIFMQDTFYQFRHDTAEHIKTWKRAENIDLKSSAGHRLKVKEPKLFPLKILNRHYPLRSMEQAEKKVFLDRKPRFKKEKSDRGWHTQYDRIFRSEDFLYQSSELLLWDESAFERFYIPFFTGCGIYREKPHEYSFSLEELQNKKIALYGAGDIGCQMYAQMHSYCKVTIWVDQDYEYKTAIYCEKIRSPEKIVDANYDYVIVAVKDKRIFEQIFNRLVSLGVDEDDILWGWSLCSVKQAVDAVT